MKSISKEYKIERLLDWEMKSLSEKNQNGKLSFKFILSIALILIIFTLIFPFLPSLKAGIENIPPQNFNDYIDEVKFTAFFLISILFLIFGIDFLKNKIDEKYKIKKLGDFEIERKINFGRHTFLLLNNYKVLFLKSDYLGLRNAKMGQIISVKKTVTNRIINLYVRDRSIFETE